MSAVNNQTDFTIKQQWERFLERCGLQPGQLHWHQEMEMKKAFYGSAGQILLMARDEISNLSEQQAVTALEGMLSEITVFWKKAQEEYDRLQSEKKTED